MHIKAYLRSVGFGGRTDFGILLAVGLNFYRCYARLDTIEVCGYALGISLLLFVTWVCSDLKELVSDSRLGKWWRQNPYMLSNSNRFMATFIELIQDRNWKVICQWLDMDQNNHQMLLLDRSQQTILHHAILYRAPAHVIEAILRRAPSLASVQNDLGEAALHWAIRLEANREILNLLLKANPGAGVYSRDHNGITPLWLLWDRKTRTMSTNEIVRMFRSSPTSWRRIEMLLDPPRGEYHRRSNTPTSLLHKVAGYPTPAGIFAVVCNMYGRFGRVRDVLGRTPLMVACSSADANEAHDAVTKVQFLLQIVPEAHSIPNHEGRLPIHVALQSGIGFGKGLEELVRLDRGESVRKPDPLSKLPLFALPVVADREENIRNLDTSYRLLRNDPSQLELLRGS